MAPDPSQRWGGALLGGWTPADAKRLETEFGFGEWEVPDAGENAKAEHFGGGNAAEGEGWDEVYTQQAERFLADVDPEKPFCLVVSLVNPHDVLGYPASYERGGYELSEFRDLGVGLPPTVDETLHNKPAVHALMRMGMNAYLGPLRNEREQLDYVNFYAHLHRVVDEKISRIVGALGDPDDPDSLRSRTVVVRCADHGEMGLSHGGLRQKAFNVYEETINVPMVISNPVLFPRPAGSDALVSLVDVLPTMLSMAEGAGDGAAAEADLRGKDLTPILADRAVASRERAGISPVDLTSVLEHPEPAPSVQDAIHFTYDDHQAGTAMREAPGQPNRVRAVRTADAKYAVYLDPKGRADSEYEMYDLERDPDETHNLVGVGDGRPLDRTAARQHTELAERLEVAMDDARTRIGSGAATRH
ncbi:MAG: sulfatase-like hydrolase/transferase [Solirubrobacterales bacterium]